MNLIETTLENLKKRRQKIIDGGINCIPSPFVRFSDDFIGIEKSTYYCITATTKGSKTQFTSYTFIFKPLLYAYNTHKVDLKILYFALEETPERILHRFISFLLYELDNIRISPRDLRSTKSAVDEKILDLIQSEKYQNLIKYFEEHVIFNIDTFNPTGIYKFCRKYAEDNGTVTKKKSVYKDEFGILQETEVFDSYIPNNPNEYRLIVIDTINLIDTEKGMTLKQSMDKLSEYLAKYLRNRYEYSPVVIQQQAFAGEDNESFKLGKGKPTVSNSGDTKYTARDANVMLGLFSPIRMEYPEYMGYNIRMFKDNIRFLEVMINRDGNQGGMIALFFDGAVCTFKELPRPDNKDAIDKIYKYLQFIRNEEKPKISMFIKSIFKFKKYGK